MGTGAVNREPIMAIQKMFKHLEAKRLITLVPLSASTYTDNYRHDKNALRVNCTSKED